MTKKLLWAMPLFGIFLLLTTSAPAIAQSKDKIYRELKTDNIASVLKDLNVKFKVTPTAKDDRSFDFEFERNNYNIRMNLSQGKLVGFWAFFPKTTLAKVNDWNKKAKFSRAALTMVDGREYAVVDSQFNAAGGVTDSILRQLVRRFDDEVAKFDAFLRN